MKKIFMYMFIAAVGLSSNSCSNSFLDLQPTNQIDGNSFYKTKDDIFQALVAAYDPLSWDDWNFGQFAPIQLVSDVMSDDILVGGANAADMLSWHQMYHFDCQATQTPSSLWTIAYAGINRANLVIINMPNIKEIDDASKNRYLAEAHFLRAYYYQILWKFWGNVPYYETNPTAPYYTAPQIKADELYGHIIDDLNKALAGNALPETVPKDELGRVTQDVARMLKTTVVMYQNDVTKYPECLADMKAIISSQRYSLYPNFEKLFQDDGEWSSESIWEINYVTDSQNSWGNPISGQGTVLPELIGISGLNGSKIYQSGWGFSPVEGSLYNLYDSNDQRRDGGILSFDKMLQAEPGITYQPRFEDTRFFNKKYTARVGYNSTTGDTPLNFRNNTRIYRYAETLLDASELLLRTNGSTTEAQSYYDQVRKRAFGANFVQIPVSLDNLLKERRLEFACEGHRFWDLVRFGKAVQVLGARGYTDNKKHLPIPQSEMDKSKGVLIQNPY